MPDKKGSATKQPEKSPGKRNAGIFLAVILLIAGIIAMKVYRAQLPLLELDGYKVYQEEYLWALSQARADVLSAHSASGISLKRWDEETELGIPYELAADRAVEILRAYYAVATLAVERGYLADASYDALRADMEEINRQRQEALESGAVITGLPNFTMDDYITYRASSIRIQFCSDPDNPENNVTAVEIRQRYETDRDRLYYQPDSLELACLLIDAAPGEADQLEQDLWSLEHLAREAGDLKAALEDMPDMMAYYQEIFVHPGNYGIYDRSHSDILAWSAELEAGDISQVFRQDNRLCLMQCLGRTVHQYMPLEDVESVVVQSIRESRYDALIAQRMENMQMQGNLQALYRFTAEQFR